MNNQLIPIFSGQIQDQSIQLVDARLLHSFLESSRQFANWIKERIEEYEFIEGQDFLTNLLKTKGRPSTEYHLTLDMAKELGMIERSEKGRQIRRYFLEMERKAQRSVAQPEPKTQKALPNGLTLPMQDIVKSLVNARGEGLEGNAKASAIIQGWSAIKSKYGKTYKAIEPEHFAGIISLLARLPIEGELLPKSPASNTSATSNTITLEPLKPGEIMKRWLVTQHGNGMVQMWAVKHENKGQSRDDIIRELRFDGFLVIKKNEFSIGDFVMEHVPDKLLSVLIEKVAIRLKNLKLGS